MKWIFAFCLVITATNAFGQEDPGGCVGEAPQPGLKAEAQKKVTKYKLTKKLSTAKDPGFSITERFNFKGRDVTLIQTVCAHYGSRIVTTTKGEVKKPVDKKKWIEAGKKIITELEPLGILAPTNENLGLLEEKSDLTMEGKAAVIQRSVDGNTHQITIKPKRKGLVEIDLAFDQML